MLCHHQQIQHKFNVHNIHGPHLPERHLLVIIEHLNEEDTKKRTILRWVGLDFPPTKITQPIYEPSTTVNHTARTSASNDIMIWAAWDNWLPSGSHWIITEVNQQNSSHCSEHRLVMLLYNDSKMFLPLTQTLFKCYDCSSGFCEQTDYLLMTNKIILMPKLRQ